MEHKGVRDNMFGLTSATDNLERMHLAAVLALFCTAFATAALSDPPAGTGPDASSVKPHGCRGCLLAGSLGVVALALWVYLFNPVGSARPFEDGGQNCLSQTKMLTVALLSYAADHHDELPSVNTWERGIMPYTDPHDNYLVCGEPGEAGKVRHVMVKQWSSVKLGNIPDQASAILLYDAAGGKPAFRHRPTAACRFERWRNALAKPGIAIGYADGHCKWSNTVTADMVEEGRDLSITRRGANSD